MDFVRGTHAPRNTSLALLCFAVVAAALAAPAAIAQSAVNFVPADLEFGVPHHLVAPPGRESVALFEITYSVREPVTPVKVAIEVAISQAPPWAHHRLETESITFDLEPGRTEYVHEVRVHVDPHRLAPAFEPESIELEARASATAVYATASARGAARVDVGYHGEVRGRIEDPAETTPDGRTKVTVGFENAGNGITRVVFEEIDAPPGVAFAVPHPISLQPQHKESGTRADVVFYAYAEPGFRGGTVLFRARTAYSHDPALEGNVLDFAFDVPAREAAEGGSASAKSGDTPLWNPVPGASAIVAILTGIAAAVAARKQSL